MRAMKKEEKKIATFKGEEKKKKRKFLEKERKKKEKERKERVGKNFLEASLKQGRALNYELPILPLCQNIGYYILPSL